jgi:hypothetical protein
LESLGLALLQNRILDFELLTAGLQMIEVRGMETSLKAIEGKQK